MAKTFQFTSTLRRNMLDKDRPGKYYALAKWSGDTDIPEMAERIERSCTVNHADVLGVLRALQTEMIESFKRGEIVRFGDIGSFYVTLHSAGTEQEKDVSVSLIKSARVRFRPGKEIKDALKTLAYSKYRLDDGEKEAGEDEEQPEPGGGTGEEDDNQESPDPIV